MSDLPPIIIHGLLSISVLRSKLSGWLEEVWLLVGKEWSERAKEKGEGVLEQSTEMLCRYGDTHWPRVH